ncbi:MAG: chromosome partition protein [Actinomycetota bacterium]|jgi:chromosome segregation protein
MGRPVGTSVTLGDAVFLKSLTLKGFKSFADSTVLELEPGVTVVVGPNGSGKSNVVDAVAWVLGAQAPRAIRGQKMEDVIFNGSTKRSALGRAEVSLTLDNSGGVLPLDFTEITISRTLFRTGESEYAINGVDCRLRDVQDLLSDAGVGRQQHVIISQGQIDAVLTARPEERREIIEEAAGVLRFRKRKESAERKLEATETALLRVQDTLREIRRQLRPLERQAEAARKHDAVAAELRALRLFLAGSEVSSLRGRLGALAGERVTLEGTEKALRGRLAALDTEVLSAEAEMTARGDSGLNDAAMRVEQLRERARGIAGIVAERRRSMERDHGQLVAEDVVAALEADAARMREDLEDVVRNIAIATAEQETLTTEEAAFEAERDGAGLFHVVDGTEAASAAAEVRGELRTLRNSVESSEGEARSLAASLESARAAAESLVDVLAGLRAGIATTEESVGLLRSGLRAARDARDGLEADVDVLREETAAAERRAARATARLEAIETAAAAGRARVGARALAQVTGVVGALVDVLTVDEGWDAAVTAALGESLSAVVVSDPTAARRAVEALRSSGNTGAVLILGRSVGGGSWIPGGVDSVRAHVRPADGAPAGLDVLLDALIAHVGCTDDIVDAIGIVEEHPEAVVVTRAGDRLSPSGWRLGVADEAGSAQRLEAARREKDDADAALSAASSASAGHWEETSRARAEVERLQSELDAALGSLESATASLASGNADRRTHLAEVSVLESGLDTVRARLSAHQARVAELGAILPALEESERAEAEAARARSDAQAAIESRASHLAMRRRDLEVRLAGLAERDSILRQRLAETETRLLADGDARRDAAERRGRIEASLVVLQRLADVVGERRTRLDSRHDEIREQRTRQSDETRAVLARLDTARRSRQEAERELDVLRERQRRIELEETESRTRLESAAESVRRELEVEPETAEAAPQPEVPEGKTHADRARELEREIRLMGPINPLALQEFTELQERLAFYEEQLNDVRSSRRELAQVIAAVDEEIRSVFADAFQDVARNFTELFAMLFPGGKGRLVLTDPKDMLNTGIDVEAQPPGKTFKKLSLLSGGERSLTAVAYLFAVFRSRPSPFYVMDEVEAALDDVNLHRFLSLVAEFRRSAQLIIVSHQKRTMEAADCLIGVTMQPGGSSRIVTERPAEESAT